MERTKTQFARIMELDRRIRGGRYPNCLTFAREWEVSDKTVQRDIDYLRYQLNAPIAYDRKHKGYHYTDENWFLPALNLSEGDLLALLVGTRALAAYRGTPIAERLERVFDKIAELLPEQSPIRPELIFQHFSFTGPPAKPVDEDTWIAVVRGLTNRRSLRISYRSFDADTAKERVVDPYHVVNLAGEWYILARCRAAEKVLQLSIARIEAADLTDEAFDIPPDFDARDLLSRTFGRFVLAEKTYRVRLRFDTAVASWILEKQWHPHQETRTLKNGSVEISFEAGGLYEVFRWVMAWGRHCRVIAPKALKDMVAEEVAAMAEN